MYYKPTKLLPNDRLSNLSSDLETLDFEVNNSSSSQRHSQLVKGLLYLATGGLDECHNIVAPSSCSVYLFL